MLNTHLQCEKSDRFILSRSSKRDLSFDKFKISDLTSILIFYPLVSSSSRKREKSSRTPQIICDEKEYTKKFYLSLLKTQLFDPYSSTHNKSLSHISKKNTSQTPPPLGLNTQIQKSEANLNHNSIVKNLNKTFYDSIFNKEDFNLSMNITPLQTSKKDKNYYPSEKKSSINSNSSLNKYIFSQPTFLFDDIVNNCSTEIKTRNNKYNTLLNLSIDDKESIYNYFRQKKIPKTSYKVLESPTLKDDFYLHLLDWSNKDFLAVGLDKSLYIWEGKTSTAKLINTFDLDYLTSVSWCNDGNHLIVGTNNGQISIWDVNECKCLKEFQSNTERVDVITTMNTNNNVYTIGLLNQSIISYDMRVNYNSGGVDGIFQFKGHTAEVCGLKWSIDDRRLASGGNDNKLIIWNNSMRKMEHKFNSHFSAVKAIDWSPHKFGYLISGGGTQDRTIKLWNINTMTLVDSVDTHSQVCNVCFSRISKEFVTTHGYSNNHILVWDLERMDVKATLKGHKDRVIYMALGPDSRNIVTGAGNETIRFWNVFASDGSCDKGRLSKREEKGNQFYQNANDSLR